MLKIFKYIPKEKLPNYAGKALNTIALLSPTLSAQLTLFLYSKPLKGRLNESSKSFLSSADSQTKLKHNQNIDIQVYEWYGVGPKILLLHGWESNAARWRPLIRLLHKKGYHVIAMDGPAHGQSGSKKFSADLYAAMADDVVKKLQPACVIGHSVGGMATLYLATHFENPSIQSLIVLAASNRWLEVASKFHLALGLNNRIIENFEDVFQKNYHMPQSYFNADNWVKKLNIPGLVIHDKDDEVNEVKDGRRIHENWKNSTYIETKGYGHSMQSKEVYQYIVSFLEKSH
ncbi:MAG TPA: alpha/beta hydrolase [Saprospiraceae bacterium]|nr:alpha/beta hydrolase [Saprospiraceae bacterium]